MQYPMPAVITGLDHDIDYIYNLSELDRAYMCVMYPRPGNQAHEKTPEWTFSFALEKTGIMTQAPDAASAITNAYAQDVTATAINVGRIRDLFARWCHDSLKATAGGGSN